MTDQLPPYWFENLPRMRDALDKSGGCYEPEDVLSMLQDNDNAFWLATPTSFLMAEVMTYPRKRVFNWSVAAGDMDELLGFGRRFAALGLQMGCSEAQLMGRPGWERRLSNYRKVAVILRCPLRELLQ